MFEEFTEPMTTTASDRAAMTLSAAWRLVVAKHRSERLGIHSSGNRSRARFMMSDHSSWLRVVCASSATGAPRRDLGRGGLDVVLGAHQANRVGSDRHGADSLFVALVPDVQDGVSLAGPDLELVVDLGDEGAHGVDHDPTTVAGRGHDLGCRSVRREHERGTVGDLVHVVDEDHAPGPELVDDMSVVDDLVVAVHRRLEDPDHPRQGLDRLFDSGTKAPGRGQQDTLDRHLPRLPALCRGPPRPGGRGDQVASMACRRLGWSPWRTPPRRSGPALRVNDELLAVDGRVPRDVIEYRLFVDEADPELEIRRGHEELTVQLRKAGGGGPGHRGVLGAVRPGPHL